MPQGLWDLCIRQHASNGSATAAVCRSLSWRWRQYGSYAGVCERATDHRMQTATLPPQCASERRGSIMMLLCASKRPAPAAVCERLVQAAVCCAVPLLLTTAPAAVCCAVPATARDRRRRQYASKRPALVAVCEREPDTCGL
jgi:hypothetical protein